MIAFLFPGQGSQHCRMGEGLFDTVNQYARVEREVDALLGFSVRELCLKGPESRLRETQYTQPCLFVVNALHYYGALEKHGPPAVLAGHSLGEYNALLAAGAFDLVTGVRLVARRGELMASANCGAMAVVLKLESERVGPLLENSGLSSLDIANYNSPLQTVISGPSNDIERAAAVFEREGAAYIQLPVSSAFHSRYMAPAADSFARLLESFSFDSLKTPILSNVTGEFYPEGAAAPTIRSLLTQQITKPVRWIQGIRHLRSQGIKSFVEAGPGGVLTRLWQQSDALDCVTTRS